MDLREIDLNLLVVFNQLLLDRSVSTAADKLGLTQPAVSNALKRLRTALKDELFLRTSRGMEPTPYALHLSEPVMYALNALQTVLARRDSFDPLTSSRNFNLAMTDIGECHFLPPLARLLRSRAPHVGLATVRNTAASACCAPWVTMTRSHCPWVPKRCSQRAPAARCRCMPASGW